MPIEIPCPHGVPISGHVHRPTWSVWSFWWRTRGCAEGTVVSRARSPLVALTKVWGIRS